MDISALLIVIITIFIPPLGVFFIAGCGPDLLINILLTVLGYFPGHIHAFYLEYVYYSRRETVMNGGRLGGSAGGVYSDRVNGGGFGSDGRLVGQQQAQGQRGYGTV